MNSHDLLKPSDTFIHRHLGPRDADIKEMLATLGVDSLDALVDQTLPKDIRLKQPLKLGQPRGEYEILNELRQLVGKNQVYRSLIGMGYYDCIVPPIIQRNILENPGWYTQYTPYQAEISQGRLEALLNYQTMIGDLTGLPLANASLLDEGTAAAEAMTMCRRILKGKKSAFFVANDCHPQTIAVVEQRARPLGIDLHIGSLEEIDFERQDLFGVLLQYPNTYGEIFDYGELVKKAHEAKAMVVVATDLLALTLLKAAGRIRCRHRDREYATVRRADGLRRPARRVYGHRREASATDARTDHRRFEGCPGQSVLSHGGPDPRAAYSPRKSHE